MTFSDDSAFWKNVAERAAMRDQIPQGPGMPTVYLPIQVLKPYASLPRYASEGAAGMDLCAALERPLKLFPGRRTVVCTGIALAVPTGYEGQIRSRSGLASKGIVVLNSPGTIDCDYRGEVKVLLRNTSDIVFEICPGDRIAQLVIAPVMRAHLGVVDALPETARGDRGFGSTGR